MKTPPRALVAWSSGKDSAFALHEARRAASVDVVAVLTTVTTAFERVAVHGVRASVLEAQARALGLPSIVVGLPFPCSNAAYEAALRDALLHARADLGITHVVFGDLFLADIRAYREAQLAPLGLEPLFPLWLRDTRALAREMLAAGLEARIVALDPAKVDRRYAGAAFDGAFLAALDRETDPCGENGEFHTCVTGGPMFAAALDVTTGETVERDGMVYADILPADGGDSKNQTLFPRTTVR